jgi:sterol desaturase/sphingolipid hydroxylase (fatty acid hydroxylase superfamily)
MGFLQYRLVEDANVYILFCMYVSRNYGLLYFIEYITQNKKGVEDIPKESYPYEFHVNICTTTAIETVTHLCMYPMNTQSVYKDVVWFVPMSLLFEIVFDFFHYWSHRMVHHTYVYKYIHKKHHTFKHPTAITSFYQDPLDLILTNSLPTLLTMWLIPKMSICQFHWIIVYKNFVEISGHSGKYLRPSCSFPQCIWIVKWLEIELYAEDHDAHHSINGCNYGKRFSLWDKMFGTYRCIMDKK